MKQGQSKLMNKGFFKIKKIENNVESKLQDFDISRIGQQITFKQHFGNRSQRGY